jgi:hypothetical protein
MPPQQRQRLLHVMGDGLDLGAHFDLRTVAVFLGISGGRRKARLIKPAMDQ